MKKGDIRRVDDLGRIVIPKKFRRILQIHENEPMEITISGHQLILEKFQLLDNCEQAAKQLIHIYASLHPGPVLICSNKDILAAKGISLAAVTPLSPELIEHIMTGIEYIKHLSKNLYLCKKSNFTVSALLPISCNEHSQGAVILLDQGKAATPEQLSAARFMAAFMSEILSNQI